MSSSRLYLKGLLLAGLSVVSTVRAEEVQCGDQPRLTVMTYNLRYASAEPPNAWPERRPLMAECIRSVQPDLIGTQEGLYPQLQDLAADLPEYTWLGLGREGGSHGEFMAVFYRTDRFAVLEYDHFWLSDTPNVIGSRTWGHSNPRMATCIRFQVRGSERQFYFLNTHLDHAVQTAREKGAALILERVRALPSPLPAILTGDFNAAAGANPAYDILVGPDRLADTWTLAPLRKGETLGTFNGFASLPQGQPRIDWILTRGIPRVAEVEVVPFEKNGRFPSDHLPVVARLTLP